MERESHQYYKPGQADEICAQIHMSYEILRLVPLRMMCPRFVDLQAELISLLRSRLLMCEAAPGHLGVERNGSFLD